VTRPRARGTWRGAAGRKGGDPAPRSAPPRGGPATPGARGAGAGTRAGRHARCPSHQPGGHRGLGGVSRVQPARAPSTGRRDPRTQVTEARSLRPPPAARPRPRVPVLAPLGCAAEPVAARGRIWASLRPTPPPARGAARTSPASPAPSLLGRRSQPRNPQVLGRGEKAGDCLRAVCASCLLQPDPRPDAGWAAQVPVSAALCHPQVGRALRKASVLRPLPAAFGDGCH
jgi:hypothetical protein